MHKTFTHVLHNSSGNQLTAVVFHAGLGAYFSKGNNTTEDFFLGSRGLPGWAVGFSLLSTTMSSVTFLAYPATSYILDWRCDLTCQHHRVNSLTSSQHFGTISTVPEHARPRVGVAYTGMGKFLPLACGWIDVEAGAAYVQAVHKGLLLPCHLSVHSPSGSTSLPQVTAISQRL